MNCHNSVVADWAYLSDGLTEEKKPDCALNLIKYDVVYIF